LDKTPPKNIANLSIQGTIVHGFRTAPSRRELVTVLGQARDGVGDFQTAEANLPEAWPIAVKTDPPAKKGSRDCARGLVDLYTAWDKAEPGNGHAAKATEWKAKLKAIETPDGK
jgi:hypothetical protein